MILSMPDGIVYINVIPNIVSMPSETTIPLKRVTVSRLVEHGRMRESYDHLINRLLDEREQKIGALTA